MKTRIISAIVMAIIAIPLLVLGGLPFKIFMTLIGIMSVYELMHIRKKKKEIPLFIRIISYILIGVFIILGTNVYTSNYEIIYKIITVIFLIYFIPVVFINDTKKYNVTDALYALGITMFLAIAYNSAIMVINADLSYLLYILIVTIGTDIFAYFTGYFIGKHKLCEKISPKKTIEGAVGGSMIGTVIATTFYLFVISSNINIFLLGGITLLLTIIGQIGDLFFSSIKRYYEVKDFLPHYANTFYFFDCSFKNIATTPVEKYIVFSKTVCYDVANRMIYDGANKENIEIIDEEDIEIILKKMDELKTNNIYILTGMKPYKKIKNFLEREALING